jgi:NAD(P)-dependent dehydrogenase (short-subunit alcohol dehydrogenase family)
MGDLDFVNEVEVDVAAPYAISKAGINMVIAKYNALYKREGILFMSICPGSVDTQTKSTEARKYPLPELIRIVDWMNPDFRFPCGSGP